MKVLLDTCVISEIVRPKGDKRVKERVASFPQTDTFLSVVTVGELARGVHLLPEGKKRDRYASALLQLEQDYEKRILPIDADTGRIWGEIDAARQRAGHPISVPDGQIAATAKKHGLHVVTRNVSDFEETGVLIIDPWEDA